MGSFAVGFFLGGGVVLNFFTRFDSTSTLEETWSVISIYFLLDLPVTRYFAPTSKLHSLGISMTQDLQRSMPLPEVLYC